MKLIDRVMERLGFIRKSFVHEQLDFARNVTKRLDEHRELVEFLEENAPDLLSEHFWVVGWLKTQDEYLQRLFMLRHGEIPKPCSGDGVERRYGYLRQEPQVFNEASAPKPQSLSEFGIEGPSDSGQRFIAWLTSGITEHQLAINIPKARLQVLSEGLRLVSPGIFQDFDPDNWKQVQGRFQKLRIHRKTPEDKNIWTYQVASSTINVMLIPDPEQRLGVRFPRSILLSAFYKSGEVNEGPGMSIEEREQASNAIAAAMESEREGR